MYDTTKPYVKRILEIIETTWETPYVSVWDGFVFKKFSGHELHHVDGIGTKGTIHWAMGNYKEAAQDAFAMNFNDLLMARATPYAVIPHLMLPKEDIQAIETIVESLAALCGKHQIAITGGETAIHDNMDGLEISLTMLGFTDWPRENLLKEGDVLVGVESSGLHSNGFTKIREMFPVDLLGEFMTPTLIYDDEDLIKIVRSKNTHGVQHITGGAFTKLKRILGESCDASLNFSKPFCVPNIFLDIYNKGISDEEMYKTFNCGIGFVLGVDRKSALVTPNDFLKSDKYHCYLIGEVVPGTGKMRIQSAFSDREVVY